MLYQVLRHPQAYPRKPASSSSLCGSYAASRRPQKLTLWGRAPRSSRLRAFQCLALKTGLKVVFVTTEVAPWSKSGGLADALSGLAAALAARGHRVMTVSPKYAEYQDALDSGARALVSIGPHSQLLQGATSATTAAAQQGSLEPPTQAGTIRDGIVVPLTSPSINTNAATIPSSTSKYQQSQPAPAAQSSDTSAGLEKASGTQGPGLESLVPSQVKLYTANKGDGVQYVFVDHPVFQNAIGAASSVYTYTGGGDGWDIQTRYSILCQAALAAPVLLWPETVQANLSPEERSELSAIQDELLCFQTQQQGSNENNVNLASSQQPARALGLRHGLARSAHAIETAQKLLTRTGTAGSITGTLQGSMISDPAVKGFHNSNHSQQGPQDQEFTPNSRSSETNVTANIVDRQAVDQQRDEPVIFVGNDWPAGLLAVWHKAGLEMAGNEVKLLETLSQYKQRMTAFDSWLNLNGQQAHTVQPTPSSFETSPSSIQANNDDRANIQSRVDAETDMLCDGSTHKDGNDSKQTSVTTNNEIVAHKYSSSQPATAKPAFQRKQQDAVRESDSGNGCDTEILSSHDSQPFELEATAGSAQVDTNLPVRPDMRMTMGNTRNSDVQTSSFVDNNYQQTAIHSAADEQLNDNKQPGVRNPSSNPSTGNDAAVTPSAFQGNAQEVELNGTSAASSNTMRSSPQYDTSSRSGLTFNSEANDSNDHVVVASNEAGLTHDKLCVFLQLIASCLRNAKFVMTIHNMAFQGLFQANTLPATGLPPTATTLDALLTTYDTQSVEKTTPLPKMPTEPLSEVETTSPLSMQTEIRAEGQTQSQSDFSITNTDDVMSSISDWSAYTSLTNYGKDVSQQLNDAEPLEDVVQSRTDRSDFGSPASQQPFLDKIDNSTQMVMSETPKPPKPCISWLQAALLTNDLILTVSPQYADELMMEAQSAIGPQTPQALPDANNISSFGDAAAKIGSSSSSSSRSPLPSVPPGLATAVGPTIQTASLQPPSTTTPPINPAVHPRPSGFPVNHHTHRSLQALQQKGVKGIMNGIDTSVWNPSMDPLLPRRVRYGVHNVKEKKSAAKALLQARLRLDINPEAPLVAYIGRLEEQKGADVILAALPELLGPSKRNVTDPRLNSTAKGATHISAGSGYRLGKEFNRLFSAARMHRKTGTFVNDKLQVVMLGAGQQWLEQCLGQLAVAWPGRAVGHGGFNEPLAHLIMAAADYLLVPSRFEPCGLVAMCAVRYGTIPIVSPVGGLPQAINATVKQPAPSNSVDESEQERLAAANIVLQARKQLGFLLPHAPPPETDRAGHRAAVFDLVRTIRDVCELYGTEEVHAMQKRCLEHNVSWASSAEAWEQALTALISKQEAKQIDTKLQQTDTE